MEDNNASSNFSGWYGEKTKRTNPKYSKMYGESKWCCIDLESASYS